MTQPILQVKNLEVEFITDDGIVRAVNDISFDLYPLSSSAIFTPYARTASPKLPI